MKLQILKFFIYKYRILLLSAYLWLAKYKPSSLMIDRLSIVLWQSWRPALIVNWLQNLFYFI